MRTLLASEVAEETGGLSSQTARVDFFDFKNCMDITIQCLQFQTAIPKIYHLSVGIAQMNFDCGAPGNLMFKLLKLKLHDFRPLFITNLEIQLMQFSHVAKSIGF